jgi:hypothetical protein
LSPDDETQALTVIIKFHERISSIQRIQMPFIAFKNGYEAQDDGFRRILNVTNNDSIRVSVSQETKVVSLQPMATVCSTPTILQMSITTMPEDPGNLKLSLFDHGDIYWSVHRIPSEDSVHSQSLVETYNRRTLKGPKGFNDRVYSVSASDACSFVIGGRLGYGRRQPVHVLDDTSSSEFNEWTVDALETGSIDQIYRTVGGNFVITQFWLQAEAWAVKERGLLSIDTERQKGSLHMFSHQFLNKPSIRNFVCPVTGLVIALGGCQSWFWDPSGLME